MDNQERMLNLSQVAMGYAQNFMKSWILAKKVLKQMIKNIRLLLLQT